MSLQFCYNLGKIARASLSHARFNNPGFYESAIPAHKKGIVAVNNGSCHQQIMWISTSKKNRETIAADVTTTKNETKEESPKKVHYWTSQGFCFENEEEDIRRRNGIMFFTVTLCVCISGFVVMFAPDPKYRDWSRREAYIEIARREALGLPHVDPNIVPPENVNLPTEEELGNFQIII